MADIHVAIVEAHRAGMTLPKISELFGFHKSRCSELVRLARTRGMDYIRGLKLTANAGVKKGNGLSEEAYGQRVLKRILARTVPNEKGCLIWQGFKFQSRGSRSWYGSTNYHNQGWRTHRLVVHLTQRPVNPHEVIMHLCDNSLCVNPEHLAFGTTQENLKDAASKGSYRYHESHYKTCKNGHDFMPENTRICKQGFRHCRQCERDRCRRYWAEGKAKERQKRYRAQKRQQEAA